MHSVATITLALGLVFGLRSSRASVKASDIHLPSYPLAVRTPYLSTWLPGNFAHDITKAQPEFWNGETLTWNIMARVVPANDASKAKTYMLMGFPNQGVHGAEPAVQKGLPTITSTHTTIDLTAGDAKFTLDFFSPVSPKDYNRQSMPYSYLTVSASSSSKADIQIFSAIDNTWTAQGDQPLGSLSSDSGVATFDVFNPSQVTYEEHREAQAKWGHTVFSSHEGQSDKLDSGCGIPQSLYSTFVEKGNVGNSATPLSCSKNDLYSHVHQFTNVKSSKSATFAVGLYQESTINYHDKPQTYYMRAEYPAMTDSIKAFFDDYADANEESTRLDALVQSHGNEVSTNYTDILEASVRQAFAPIQITIPSDTLSTSAADVNGFLKEISSDGNVNSVDVIYPTFPIFYVLAPDYITLCLQPILSYLATPTGVWDKSEMPHDLGNHYPNATGHDGNKLEILGHGEELMPLQVTGSMFSMLLAYVNATADHAFVDRYMGADGKYLLTTYADMLVEKGLHPPKELTTVDALAPVADTTQLAITSALGVSAFGALTGLQNYTIKGAAMTHAILNDAALGAISTPARYGDGTPRHFTYDYAHPSSYSVTFPLFADKLAALAPSNSFSPAYAMQSAFYSHQLAQHPAGLRYSDQAPWGITEWNLWAASTSSADVSKGIVDSTWSFLTGKAGGRVRTHWVPFGTKYDVTGMEVGAWKGNKARSTVGGNFALLAVKGSGLIW